MIELKTTRFGIISFEEERVITMKRGLIGFADKHRFITLSPTPNSTLLWYQSVEDPALAFVITTPGLFVPDYNIKFGNSVLEALEASGPGELDVYVLVTIPPGKPREMTGNLLGPLVVNPRARLAEQLIMDETKYSHKQPLGLVEKK